jgi:DNA-binding transcriptional regulator LsrR (DeoR family)
LSITTLLSPIGISPELLMGEGVVGDLCYCFFDADGKGRADWQYFLTVGHGTRYPGVEFYKRLVRKDQPVIVSAGQRKEKAILPAIKHELFNVLITDVHTAEALLKA